MQSQLAKIALALNVLSIVLCLTLLAGAVSFSNILFPKIERSAEKAAISNINSLLQSTYQTTADKKVDALKSYSLDFIRRESDRLLGENLQWHPEVWERLEKELDAQNSQWRKQIAPGMYKGFYNRFIALKKQHISDIYFEWTVLLAAMLFFQIILMAGIRESENALVILPTLTMLATVFWIFSQLGRSWDLITNNLSPVLIVYVLIGLWSLQNLNQRNQSTSSYEIT